MNARTVCGYLVSTTFGNTTFDPNGTTTALPTDSDGLTETEKILIGVLVPVRKDFKELFACSIIFIKKVGFIEN